MRILLIEDDANKRDQVLTWLQEHEEVSAVRVAKSYHSGVRALMSEPVALVVLDMSMPTYDVSADEPGGRPQPFGGREILRQMTRRGILVPVVVVTQFDRFGEGGEAMTLTELDAQLKRDHADQYLGAIFYHPTTDEWKDLLQRVLDAHR